jgi:hypothetical protein
MAASCAPNQAVLRSDGQGGFIINAPDGSLFEYSEAGKKYTYDRRGNPSFMHDLLLFLGINSMKGKD